MIQALQGLSFFTKAIQDVQKTREPNSIKPMRIAVKCIDTETKVHVYKAEHFNGREIWFSEPTTEEKLPF